MVSEGLKVVLSAPSATGKGTIMKMLQQRDLNIKMSISATTRKPREGEIDGVHYDFKEMDEFESLIENEGLIEWVQYCGNYYGTPKSYIDEATASGFDVFLELEVEGALNIKNSYPDCVMIFLLPPSFDELKDRIISRGTESEAVIEKRMNRARQEIAYIKQYDYVVVNDELEVAVSQIQSILMAEKLKYKRSISVIKQLGILDGGNSI